MVTNARMMIGAIAVAVVAISSEAVTDLNKTVADAESRKRAAENGLREIKTKTPQPSEEIKKAYVEAASRQNTWVDATCHAIEQGAAATPDVAGTAQNAAAALVAWVNVRNTALALPPLAGAAAESATKSVTEDLAWKTFEEVQ
jgi:flagellar hook-basal body complex protein FliE